MEDHYNQSLAPKLIYVMRINDKAHKGCLKIGETTVEGDVSESSDLFRPNSSLLNQSARKRINSYTQTAAVAYDLLYTEGTVHLKGKRLLIFHDYDVHKVLERSGIKKKFFSPDIQADEWYITDLETVKRAIAAVKAGRESLHTNEISEDRSPIVFRPEQKAAIEKTKKQFKKNNRMLWNAKMRFGKTLSALQVVKDFEFTRTLILTHRPAVNDGWFEDFNKIFYDRDDFVYGSKIKGENFTNLEKYVKRGKHYVYFASMQDLRGSEIAGGKFDKNNELFSADWDLIINDEAHEGTKTDLGQNVLKELTKDNTKILQLSGTPFNLLDEYQEEEIYTWDYVMEQKAKADWFINHPGDHNPYEALPRLNIFTFDLGKQFSDYVDEDVAFNFHEFFRVGENGEFIHKRDVIAFLNLICKKDSKSNYPYSTEKNQKNFRHSFWRVPGVKEARALSTLLQEHPVFGQFQIVNVAGEGDDDAESDAALNLVNDAIGPDPEETYTITLSCGRLTTGVSVPAWTAVFMLAGSFNTSASSYMQTIFRCQTPATINGKVKTECFVFDFAPDRTLKVIAETAKISAKAGKTSGDDRKAVGDFLNFCPVISMSGTKMTSYNVDHMLEQLKKVYVERVVRNGFEDGYLYNNDALMKLDGIQLKEFDALKRIIGQTKAMPKSGDIDINNQGFTDEQYGDLEDVESKKRKGKELTEEEKKLLAEKKEKKKNRDTAVSILRGISIRMPLMLYGAELNNEDQEITIDNFADLIDQQSWDEFMPTGVSKETFETFKKYYEPDVFRAAGKRIRAMARAADSLGIEERIERITAIFNSFRNPDKETVLTPWRVVNMHLSDSLGGYVFFDESFEKQLLEPRYVNQGQVTSETLGVSSKVLEVNSKSGLYPLYVAYSIYQSRLYADKLSEVKLTLSRKQKIWDQVLTENLFVICKTPMAKSITKRTLMGFRSGRINAHYFENLTNTLKYKPQQFIDRISRPKCWGLKGHDKMKFDAIVGNPPYQEALGGASPLPIYQYFVNNVKTISPSYASLIIPARWFNTGTGLDDFRKEMLQDTRISIMHDYIDATECFQNVDIKGGIIYFLWDKKHDAECHVFTHNQGNVNDVRRYLHTEGADTYIRDNNILSILHKVALTNPVSFSTIVSSRDPFGYDRRLPNSFKVAKHKFELTKQHSSDVVFYYNGWRKDGVGYVPLSDVTEHCEWIDKAKVLIPKAWGTGKSSLDRLNPFLAKTHSVCTETYLVVGPFDKEIKANNAIAYINTKFFHMLVSVLKISQNAAQGVYKYVPLQDFSTKSDIDWTVSIPEIDQQLYAKYGLSDDEINFIETAIKPME